MTSNIYDELSNSNYMQNDAF